MSNKLTAYKPATGTKPSIGFGVQNTTFRNACEGKTLAELADLWGLEDSQVAIRPVIIGEGRSYQALCIEHQGKENIVPFSRNYPMDRLDDAEYLLNSKFRLTHVVKRNEKGDPITDENGNDVFDESKPYLTFGKPEGITVGNKEELFTTEMLETAGKS